MGAKWVLHKQDRGTSIESNTVWARTGLLPTCNNARTCEDYHFMAPHKTITVNGRTYDAVTGLPVASEKQPETKPASSVTKPVAKPVAKTAAKKPAPSTPRSQTTATSVHSTVQRSQTLNRRAAKKPAVPNKPITRRQTPGRLMDVARSTNVSKFAANPVTTPKPVAAAPAAKPAAKATSTKADKPAQLHPLAQRAFQRTAAKKPVAVAKKPTTAKEVKDAAIAKALATPKPAAKKVAKARKQKYRRVAIVAVVVLALILAVAAAYRLMPGISVSMASAQAGISATYPEYTPDGYTLSQPVKFSEGEVVLKFASNSNDNYYTVAQTRSSWDSTAVLDNVVTPAAGADYVTTKERGLTIYTYESAAVWVNGGILYKIDSKAPLSGDQIRKIATSL